MDPVLDKDLANALRLMEIGFGVWLGVYVVLGALSVALPVLAATGLFSERRGRMFAAAGAVAAALFTFLRPFEYASGYDAASQSIWGTKIAYDAGTISASEATTELSKAFTVTTFRYGGLAEDHNRIEPPSQDQKK